MNDYRENPTFSPDYVEEYFAEKPKAPFPVSVTGVLTDGPFLGVGQAIGVIEDGMPVIELEEADGSKHQILGCECWWTTPVPEEMINLIVSGRLAVASIRTYIEDLRTIKEMEGAEDIDDIGIDPDSN
jgi:hypothetical protein